MYIAFRGLELTGPTGSLAPFDNQQPTLNIRYFIVVAGNAFPSERPSELVAYIGEIFAFATPEFVPAGCLPADGRLMNIVDNQALFSVLGTTYGGDGITNFRLPDLRGRVPVGASSQLALGAAVGSDLQSISVSQLPAHVHQLTVPATPPVLQQVVSRKAHQN